MDDVLTCERCIRSKQRGRLSIQCDYRVNDPRVGGGEREVEGLYIEDGLGDGSHSDRGGSCGQPVSVVVQPANACICAGTLVYCAARYIKVRRWI